MYIKQTARDTKNICLDLLQTSQSLENVSPLGLLLLVSHCYHGKEDGILGGPLRAINSLSAEYN